MLDSAASNVLSLRQDARARAADERRSQRVRPPVDRHADPLALFGPVTLPMVFQLILLGLGMMLLPVLLPLAARRRRPPPVF